MANIVGVHDGKILVVYCRAQDKIIAHGASLMAFHLSCCFELARAYGLCT